MQPVTIEPIRILLVEDDEADILLARRAFEKASIWNKMDITRDGQQTLDYLRNEKNYADKNKYPLPDLILLDLNLPGINGRDVLGLMRKESTLKDVPVVIVSTSDYEKDIEFGRKHNVQHYMIKPIQTDNLMEIFTVIPGFKIVLSKKILE